MAIRGLLQRVITIAEITCSTPNGVMAIRGGVDLRRSGRRQRAQRLTASWRFAGWRSASNPILHIGAQRLTASRRFADASGYLSCFDGIRAQRLTASWRFAVSWREYL